MSNVAWNDAWNAGQAVLRRQLERARPFRITGWTQEAINRERAAEVPDLESVAVALVPRMPGYMTGIAAAGRTNDGHFYVLGDYSMTGTPAECMERAVAAYRDHEADVIAGEVNQLGYYLEKLLRTVDDGVQYKALRAIQGCGERARFVGGLYEQGRVHHAGALADLEDHMAIWDGIHSTARIGALVCAITELSAPPI